MVWSLLRPKLWEALVQNTKRNYFIQPKFPARISKKLSCFESSFPVQNQTFQHYCMQVAENNEEILEKTIKDIADGNLENENKLRLVLLEIDVLRQDGKRAPSLTFIKKQHWERFLTLNTRSSRMKYMNYLFDIEMKELNRKTKQIERNKHLEVVREELKAKRENQIKNNEIPSDYSLQGLSMFLRIYETSINKTDNYRLHMASLFGQPLVLDCSYDNHMTYIEQANAGNQMTMLFASNRQCRDPFDIHFCNVDHEAQSIKMLYRNIPSIENDESFPINIHTESYLSLFPKEKLVYLTPHCRTELTEFDHDSIYIVGCMVDKAKSEPLSLAKAKENKLKVAKLPLDKYLSWNTSSGKSLTLDQMIKILLTIKATNDWNAALKHVPRRKVVSEDLLQRKERDSKILSKFTYTTRSNVNYDTFRRKKRDSKDPDSRIVDFYKRNVYTK